MGRPKVTPLEDALALYVRIPASHRPLLDRYAAVTGLPVRNAASLLLRISLAQFEELEKEKGPAEGWAQTLDQSIIKEQELDRSRRTQLEGQ